MENQQMEFGANNKRPVFLKVLCILTYIFTGFAVLGALISLLSGPPDASALETVNAQLISQANQMREMGATGFAHMIEKIMRSQEQIVQKFTLYNLTFLIAYATGLIGALFMYRGKKQGFQLYIIYCVLYSGANFIFISMDNIVWFMAISGLIISGVFVFMYSRNLHWLK